MVFKLFGEIATSSKTTPYSMPYFANYLQSTVNNLPILCLQFLKAVMKLSQ
jgi:hypothetical protein